MGKNKNHEEIPVWAFVQLADFDVPRPPASDAARGGLARLWRTFRSVSHSEKTSSDDEKQWNHLSVDQSRSASPDLEWADASEILTATLDEDWFHQQQPALPIRTFVATPGCDVAAVLRLVAERRQLKSLAAPAAETILESGRPDSNVLEELDREEEQVIVIPQLERWFLRHANGLTWIRQLVERLQSGRTRALIGCDSWAWAFLQRAIGIQDLLGDPQALAPFTPERLDKWFRTQPAHQRYIFRQTTDDACVFPALPDSGETTAESRCAEVAPLIKKLAAMARGNPAVALHLWRAALRSRNGQDETSESQDDRDEPVVWVASPSETESQQTLFDFERVHCFVLHVLLLHRGLPTTLLCHLLPFPRDEIRRWTGTLKRAGIIEEKDERLGVKLEAYPRVRKLLDSEGFLTDAF